MGTGLAQMLNLQSGGSGLSSDAHLPVSGGHPPMAAFSLSHLLL